jgi:hypothetical protein
MTNQDFDKLIGKYAILLSAIYLGNFLLTDFGLLIGIPILVYFITTNIIIAILVSLDLKKAKIKSSIIIWSCIIFNILGVVLFFLQVIRQEKKASA